MDMLMKTLTTFSNAASVNTDNAIFRLHYRFTVAMLAIFSVLVTTKQYFGDPIDCDTSGSKAVHYEAVKTFCWIYGTYTLKSTINDRKTPGLGNEAGVEETWHVYYQWISVVLLLQAFFFYLPFYLWSVWEGGRMAKVVNNLDGPFVPTSWNENTKRNLVDYLISFEYLHSLYVFRYFLCEFLNFLNSGFQLFFINWLFKGEFYTYGLSVMNSDTLHQNSLSPLFPKITKCKYQNYGPGGSYQSHDFLCILPLNVLNEKLFLILWFWLMFLVIVSFFVLVYRLLFVFPKLRAYILLAQIRYFDLKQTTKIVDSISFGGFFVLYVIGKNVNPVVFKELCSALYESAESAERIKRARKSNVIVV